MRSVVFSTCVKNSLTCLHFLFLYLSCNEFIAVHLSLDFFKQKTFFSVSFDFCVEFIYYLCSPFPYVMNSKKKLSGDRFTIFSTRAKQRMAYLPKNYCSFYINFYFFPQVEIMFVRKCWYHVTNVLIIIGRQVCHVLQR